MEKQTGHNCKEIVCDPGTEFKGPKVREWTRKSGIIVRTSPIASPQPNGLAERHIYMLQDMLKANIHHSTLSAQHWHLAVPHSVDVHNYTLHSHHPYKTPHELMWGSKPDIRYMHPFGCIGYQVIPKRKRSTGGFGHTGKRCRYLHQGTLPGTHCVLLEDGKIEENVASVRFADTVFEFPQNKKDIQALIELVDKSHGKSSSDSNQNQNPSKKARTNNSASDNSHRSRESKDRTNNVDLDENADTYTFFKTLTHHQKVDYAFSVNYAEQSADTPPTSSPTPNINSDELVEPESYAEAKRLGYWGESMEEEISALERNDTWKIVEIPPGVKLIFSKWVYKLKRDRTGKVYRLKSRLVAKGFMQSDRSWYERFAPTARMASIRILIALALKWNLVLTQADVNNAYLHGDLKVKVYMKIPQGLRHKYNPKKFCCRLDKSLYGLKEAAKVWNDTIDTFLKNRGFHRLHSDPCVYVKRHKSEICIIAIYVDDCTIASTPDAEITKDLIKDLKKCFGIKDHKPLSDLLGVAFDKTDSSYTMCQESYIDRMLEKYKLNNANDVDIPIPTSAEITNNEGGSPCDKTLYRSMVGTLGYIASATRPDISYAFSKLSRYFENPTNLHLRMAKRVFRYLKRTKHYKLVFTAGQETDTYRIYADADYAGDRDNRKSTSGIMSFLFGCLIHWQSRIQPIVARSTAEAEYIALFNGIEEGNWVRNFLGELQTLLNTHDIVKYRFIMEDNEACIKIASSPQVTQRSKSIDVKYHYSRFYIQNGIFKIVKTPSAEQLADILTKPATSAKLSEFRDIVFPKPISSE